MKQIVFTVAISLVSISLWSQTMNIPAFIDGGGRVSIEKFNLDEDGYYEGIDEKDVKLKAGNRFIVKDVYAVAEKDGSTIDHECKILIEYEGQEFNIDGSYLDDLRVELAGLELQSYWSYLIQVNEQHKSNLENNWNYELRNEIRDELDRWVNYLKSYDLIYEDEVLTDYLYTVLKRIYPGQLPTGRPGNISVSVITHPDPNAFALLDGRILITSGMLTTIQSEDELVALLSHELAHILKDHTIANIQERIRAERRAQFWTAFATAVAATGEVYMNAKYDVYTGGNLTYLTYLSAATISASVVEEMGFRYSREQEKESDNIAYNIIGQAGYDRQALSTMLTRLQDHHIENGQYQALSGSGTHPALGSRIARYGSANLDLTDMNYLTRVANLITINATMEYEREHFTKALSLVELNFKSGSATEEDYVLKAILLRRIYNTKEKNEEALRLLEKALTLNASPSYTTEKEFAITALRLKQYKKAGEAIDRYIKQLNETRSNLAIGTQLRNSINEELDWSQKLAYRIQQGLDY